MLHYMQPLLHVYVEYIISYVLQNESHVQEYTISIINCVTCNWSTSYILLTESHEIGIYVVYCELYHV